MIHPILGFLSHLVSLLHPLSGHSFRNIPIFHFSHGLFHAPLLQLFPHVLCSRSQNISTMSAKRGQSLEPRTFKSVTPMRLGSWPRTEDILLERFIIVVNITVNQYCWEGSCNEERTTLLAQ